MMSRERLGHAGFLGFLATQALGAFNDNAFRFAMLFAIRAASEGPAQSRLTGLAQVLFAVPFAICVVEFDARMLRPSGLRAVVLGSCV